MNDVFALGDTTILTTGRLPGTAQVANQQAQWLARTLNASASAASSSSSTSPSASASAFAAARGFSFRDLGVMTYLGGSRAVLQAPKDRDAGAQSKGLRGWVAYLVWRGAYLTFTLSWRNKVLVPVQWAIVKLFGRDVSRF